MAEHSMECPKLPWMIDFFSTKCGNVPNQQLRAAFASNRLEYLKNLNFESQPARKRLTGIICTLGPKSSSVEAIEQLIEAGMCVARIKMPFYTKSECDVIVKNVRTAVRNYSRKLGTMYLVAIAMDLRGPEIRTGTLQNSDVDSIHLQQGNETTITSDPNYEEHVTEDMIYVDYQKINEIIEPGDKFYLDNKVTLSALEIVGSFIRCVIECAGNIGDRVSVNIENTAVDLPTVSEIEVEHAKDMDVDIVIVSAVKDKHAIRDVRKMLGVDGQAIAIVAKIENAIGVKNIEEIAKEADGVLISRSDLSYEVAKEKLFLIQKKIIAVCNQEGKPVIVAPQLLESMISNPTPLRSEVLDISNAILDGADCVLLSKETASGDYALNTVRTLHDICIEAECAVYQRQVFNDLAKNQLWPYEPIYALSISVVEASIKCNAAVIIVLTTSGRTAREIVKYRPRCPIIAITRHEKIARKLRLYRGVDPILFISPPISHWHADVKRRIQFGITYGKYMGFIIGGDSIIVVNGSRAGSGFTNSMSIYYASDFDVPKPKSSVLCNVYSK